MYSCVTMITKHPCDIQDKDAVVTDTVVAAAFVSASELGAGASPDLHAAATGSSHSPTSMV